MANHLREATSNVFTNIETSINVPSRLLGISPFNRFNEQSNYQFENNWLSYLLYKGNTVDLTRIPLYLLLEGVPNSAFITFMYERPHSNRSIGDALLYAISYSIRQRGAEIGYDNRTRISKLNINSSHPSRLSGALLSLPFSLNPYLLEKQPDEYPELLAKVIDKTLTLPEVFFTRKSKQIMKGTYLEVHSAIGNVRAASTLTNWKFKDFTISCTFGTIVDFERKKVLVSLTLNPEYLEYFLLHKYSGTTSKIIPAIFNISIDKEFYNNSSKIYTKELWKLVRVGMIDKLDTSIEIDVIDGNELFSSVYSTDIEKVVNKVHGPLEVIENNAVLQEEFIAFSSAATKLDNRRITITT